MKLTKGKIKKYLLKENQSRKIYKKSNKSNNCHNSTYKQKQTLNLRTKTLKKTDI
jgi:hypothetical protein